MKDKEILDSVLSTLETMGAIIIDTDVTDDIVPSASIELEVPDHKEKEFLKFGCYD